VTYLPKKRTQYALGSNQSMPATHRMAPRIYGSLGDDIPADTSIAVPSTLPDPTAEWRANMLAQSTAIAKAQEDFTRRESMARWVQIGATLSIPLAAAVWRAIFRSGRRSGDSE
jgi:hypothetical protein